MNFADQAETYLKKIATRRRGPVKTNTLHVYRSLLDVHILPTLGREDLANVDNDTVKSLVDRLAEADLSPSTINLAVTIVKQIMKSAVDRKGHPLYPRVWDMDFMEVPVVDPASQKAPICPREGLQEAISATNGEVKALVALLAGTGLRIGEALAVSALNDGISNFWDKDGGTITIRATMINGTIQHHPKTKAGGRVVDLDPSLASFLRSQFANREERIFLGKERTLRNRIEALGIDGFHSLRRFRITHLQSVNVPTSLVKFWAGHAAGDITERYTKIGSQIEERKAWSERAGLGFQI